MRRWARVDAHRERLISQLSELEATERAARVLSCIGVPGSRPARPPCR